MPWSVFGHSFFPYLLNVNSETTFSSHLFCNPFLLFTETFYVKLIHFMTCIKSQRIMNMNMQYTPPSQFCFKEMPQGLLIMIDLLIFRLKKRYINILWRQSLNLPPYTFGVIWKRRSGSEYSTGSKKLT